MSRPELEDAGPQLGQSLGEHPGQAAYSVFMLRIARRDMMASVTAFLNCLKGQFRCWLGAGAGEAGRAGERWAWLGRAHLMARYMGRMANRGKVCTLIMMVIKAM